MDKEIDQVQMADITDKDESHREATASGRLNLRPITIRLIKSGKTIKGDPFPVAEVAAVMAAKNTPQIVPFCHPLLLTDVKVKASIQQDSIQVTVRVKSKGKTGVEMEAITATAAYLLTFWDMVKAHEKDETGQYPNTVIEEIRVEQKMKRLLK